MTSMRVLIAGAGSRGDVAPFTGLGAALDRAGVHSAMTLVAADGCGHGCIPEQVRGG